MTSGQRAFFALLTCSLVLYVYRFAVLGVNLSLFRVVLLTWLVATAVAVVSGRVRFEQRHWPFMAIAAGIAIINLVDFLSLSGYPILRRDIANHLLNVTLAGLVLLNVRTREAIHGLLRAFALSSLVTTAIAVYAGTMNRLPFESAIRSFGSAQAQKLAYVNDDLVFERATSSFFDPNIYGIYSMLVIAVIVYLWLYDRPARYLAPLFVANLVCMTMTLSRTAVVGALAVFGITFVLSARSRLFSTAAVVATIGMLYLSTAFQSYDAHDQLQEQIAKLAENAASYWHSTDTGSAGSATGSDRQTSRASGRAANGLRGEVQGRVANARSLEDRREFIERGRAVFEQHPLVGGGSVALVTPKMPLSTAHLSYLTLLARYGVLGTAVYVAFLLLPLARTWLRPAPAEQRFFVTVVLVPLMVVYLSYDIFLFFEVQYLLFGVALSMALNRPGGASLPAEAR